MLGAASAQAQDTVAGTWNIVGNVGGAYIGKVSFTGSGSVVENDTININPITTESISLGTWQKTKGLNYTVNEENYLYDTSGNLIYLAVEDASLVLAANGKSFTESITVTFYNCSLSTCPGTLVGTDTGTATATRF
jgi:hypothetical protein